MKPLCVSVCLAFFACAVISAAGTALSKAAAQINTVTTCGAFASSPCTNTDSSGRWLPVMTTQIKTSNVADLFASVSLVTGIYTSTTVRGNNTGSTSTAVAEGTVRVRVLLDPSSAACQSNCTAYKTLPDLNNGVAFDHTGKRMNSGLRARRNSPKEQRQREH